MAGSMWVNLQYFSYLCVYVCISAKRDALFINWKGETFTKLYNE